MKRKRKDHYVNICMFSGFAIGFFSTLFLVAGLVVQYAWNHTFLEPNSLLICSVAAITATVIGIVIALRKKIISSLTLTKKYRKSAFKIVLFILLFAFWGVYSFLEIRFFIGGNLHDELGSNGISLLGLFGKLFLVGAYVFLVFEVWTIFKSYLNKIGYLYDLSAFFLTLTFSFLVFWFIYGSVIFIFQTYEELIIGLITILSILSVLLPFSIVDNNTKKGQEYLKLKKLSLLIGLLFVISLLLVFRFAFAPPFGIRQYFATVSIHNGSVTGILPNALPFNIIKVGQNSIVTTQILINRNNSVAHQLNAVILYPLPFACSSNNEFIINGTVKNFACYKSNTSEIPLTLDIAIFTIIYDICLYCFAVLLKIYKIIP